MCDVGPKRIFCFVTVDECETQEEAVEAIKNFFDPLVNNGYDWITLDSIAYVDEGTLNVITKSSEELYGR